MYPITRFNSWQMQLCVIAGPVSWPRKCGIYRGVVTERDERDESSSFFSFLFLFSLSFLFFFSSLFLHFFFFPFSFLFLFFIFSRFFSGRFGRFLGFGLHTGLQQRAVKRRNFSSRRCTRGWRICVTRVDWKLWGNNVGGFFFLRARIRFGDYPFFLNKEQIQSIYFFEFLKFFYGRSKWS